MAKTRLVVPSCLALILCDTVIEDKRTNNKSLINLFSGVLSPKVPVRHDKMCAYAVFTGGRGRIPITLRLCFDAEYTKDLMRLNGTLEFPPGNPNAVVDLTYEIRGFVFTQFGGYTFELLCDEVPILSRRFMVKEPPSPPQRPTDPRVDQAGGGSPHLPSD